MRQQRGRADEALGAKLAVLWSAVVAGFSEIPWSHIAAALASVYSLHLIVGWWLDRLRGPTPPRRRANDKRASGWWRR